MSRNTTGEFKLLSQETASERIKSALAAAVSPLQNPRVRTGVIAAMILLLGAGGTWAYIAFKPVPKPEVLVDDLDDSLNYMLLSDEFNKLSLKERRELIKDLIKRMKGMDAESSALMAAFAAGIMGPAREQLRKNAEKLVVDQVDEFAEKYAKVPKDKRDEALDEMLNELVAMMEDLGDVKLPERFKKDVPGQAKKEAQRNVNRMRNRDSNNQFRDRAANAAMDMTNRASQLASPKQMARMSLFMRDMTRHLRGENIDTGQPLPPPEPPQPPAEQPPTDGPAPDPNAPAPNPGATPPAPPGGG